MPCAYAASRLRASDLVLDAEQARAVGFGQRIAWTGPDPAGDPVALIDPEGEFLALAVSDEGTARYLAVLG
jgi:hypothetical protein